MNHYAIIVLIVAVASLHSCEAAAFGGKCGTNEVWKSCGIACPPTCKEPSIRKPCTMQCVIGCQCKDGFYEHEGSCLNSRQCAML